MQIASIGIDLGKTTFHLVALGERNKILLRRKFSRSQLLAYTANLPSSLIGLEACAGSHFLGSVLREQGHQVRLIPAQFVKPYRKTNKNDFIDAEAIAEAVSKQNMRFVQIKSQEQLDIQAMHRVRDRLVQRRTALINEIRGFLLDRGLTFAARPIQLRKKLPSVIEDAEQNLSSRLRWLLDRLWQEWKQMEVDIKAITEAIERIGNEDALCRRLRQIPGFGPLVSTATVAAIGNGAAFRRGRDFAAWLWGDDGFIVVGCADPAFPNESQALLLSVAANQAAVALQAASLRAQAELERHRLQDLLARAPAAIGLLSGPEHRWIFVNENYIRVTGRNSPTDFVGKTLRESLPEIETQPFIELLDGVYRTGKSYVGREMTAKLNRAQSGQPEEGYFDFVYEPLRNSEGVVDGIFVHAVEVTDKVLARQDIEKRERQFREMIDALPAAIYTTDAAGRVTHFNPAAVEFSGRTPELGTDQWCVSWKLFYPDGRPMPHDECPMAIALKEGRVIKGAEAIAECPDGTRRWFTPYPTLLRDDQGKIIGGINMLVDITARKQAEEATGYLAAIVSSSDDAILSKNLDGMIRSWNKSAERLFGYAAKEAIGKHITIIVPSDRRTEEANILSRLRRGERIDHFETVRMRKDGSIFDVSLTISPIKDSAGRVIGASNVARDISHLKCIERALRDSEERYRTLAEGLETEVRARTRELEERNNEILRQTEQVRELSWRLLRAQDEERRHIARELHDSAGQTLTVLGMNLVQFVQKTGRAAPEVAAEAETIQEMVQQLHRDIRTTSYLLHPPLLDESGLYSALSWYTQGLVERSGLQIRLDMSEDFGRLPRDMELVVFRLIQECLTNIHRHSGSKLASIRVVRESDHVAVEVRDQGAGMSPERLAQVQSGVSGVGIRGIRERLRQFKGEMKIQSDSSGTQISVTIPVPKNATTQNESSPESLQAAI